MCSSADAKALPSRLETQPRAAGPWVGRGCLQVVTPDMGVQIAPADLESAGDGAAEEKLKLRRKHARGQVEHSHLPSIAAARGNAWLDVRPSALRNPPATCSSDQASKKIELLSTIAGPARGPSVSGCKGLGGRAREGVGAGKPGALHLRNTSKQGKMTSPPPRAQTRTYARTHAPPQGHFPGGCLLCQRDPA